jgi:hypothetical protein
VIAQIQFLENDVTKNCMLGISDLTALPAVKQVKTVVLCIPLSPTNVMVEWLTLLLHTLKVSGSNLGPGDQLS